MRNKKTNSVIMILLVVMLGLTIGYAALSTTLTISGTSNVTGTWNVAITNITAGTLSEASNATPPTYTGTTATFSTNLNKPGASATYTVTVKNSGNIVAKLSSINGVTEANAAEPTDVTYTVTGINVNDTLAAGASKTITVKVDWKSSATKIPTTKTKTMTLALNFVQA